MSDTPETLSDVMKWAVLHGLITASEERALSLAHSLELQVTSLMAEKEWQPISSAPKDGTEIEGIEGRQIRITSWTPLDNPVARHWGISGTWEGAPITSGKNLMGGTFQPTHWRPHTPPAPTK